MSKTIEIPISVYNRHDSVARIDVEAVAAFAVQVRNGARGCGIKSQWRQAGLFDFADDGSGTIVISPRCEDLIASLPHLPDDPAPEPETSAPLCGACNGTGEQMLFTSTHVCDACGGSKVAPVGAASVTVRKILDAVLGPDVALSTPAGLLYNPPYLFDATRREPVEKHAADELAPRSSCDGWVLIDSEDVARSFVGKTVEVDAPATTDYPAAIAHGKRGKVLHGSRIGMLVAGNGVHWENRGNVRLRVIDEG